MPYPSAPTIGSANIDAPQTPYSALGDLFASGMFQQPWTPPAPPAAPQVYAGMQSLAMPNDPQSTLRSMAPLMRGGVSMPFAGGTLSANASGLPFQPGSAYGGLSYRRSF